MKTFILIHGSFHGAWNWFKVTPHFEAAGCRVIAMDMPGHNLDHTAPQNAGLSECVNAVIAEANKQSGKVVLVAHSRNGIVISQVAERIPHKIERLIYIAAYLVPNGKCMMEFALLDR